MTLLHPGVLALLIGVPAGIIALIYLGVSIVKRQRDAYWFRANELERSPQTENERAALAEYDQPAKPPARDPADEEFFKQTVVEAKLQKLASFDTEYLGAQVFTTEDYPTEADCTRLVNELRKRNGHVRGLSYTAGGYKVSFGQVTPPPDPTPKCKHDRVEGACVFCHECPDSDCRDWPKCRKGKDGCPHVYFSKDPCGACSAKEEPSLTPAQQAFLQELIEREKGLADWEKKIKVDAEDLEDRKAVRKTEQIRLLYAAMPDKKLAKAIATLGKFSNLDNAAAHIVAARAEAQGRVDKAQLNYDTVLKKVTNDLDELLKQDKLKEQSTPRMELDENEVSEKVSVGALTEEYAKLDPVDLDRHRLAARAADIQQKKLKPVKRVKATRAAKRRRK